MTELNLAMDRSYIGLTMYTSVTCANNNFCLKSFFSVMTHNSSPSTSFIPLNLINMLLEPKSLMKRSSSSVANHPARWLVPTCCSCKAGLTQWQALQTSSAPSYTPSCALPILSSSSVVILSLSNGYSSLLVRSS